MSRAPAHGPCAVGAGLGRAVASPMTSSPGKSQTLECIWPGATYDPAIPAMEQVLGYDTGLEITPPDKVGVYLQALAKAAPTRTRFVECGRTWEGRPLHLLIIGSPERIDKLNELQHDLQRLADPRGLTQATVDRLAKKVPVVISLVHGTHGNEISPTDAALFEAYHLLACRGDADIERVRRETLVLISPMHNPDGRARFVLQHLQARAVTPDPTPYSAEHDEPWPGGRTNHYLFDLNRDWFAQTQPESHACLFTGRRYAPHIRVDLHEHGGNRAYFFGPPAEPISRGISASQQWAWDLFGRANGARFDQRGWAYFLREVYDAFYPGYSDCWSSLNGVIGMTYESPTARALSFDRADDSVLTYRDGVMRHANAALMTVITAAKYRERIVREFVEYRQGAVAEGETSPVRECLLVNVRDRSRVERLARTLALQGIEVRRATEAFELDGRRLPAGTGVVTLAQPSARLIHSLLDTGIEQPAEFVKRQEKRRAERLPAQIYDTTAWNLPLLHDVELVTTSAPIPASVPTQPVDPHATPSPVAFARTNVAYLIPWGSAAAAAVVEALQQGLRVHSVGGNFELGGRLFALGTAVIRVAENPSDLHERLTALAAKYGVEIVATDTSYVESGTSLGSDQTVFLRQPHVLLAWDTPTHPQSAGWARYTLERRYGQHVTIVRTSSLGRVKFANHDVVVLPSGDYGGHIKEDVVKRLRDWLREGGTLITLAEATRWATSADVKLLSTTCLLKDGRPDVAPSASGSPPEAGNGGKPATFDYERVIQPDRERPASQPGAVLRVLLDTNHWLSAGTTSETHAMVVGDRVFAPLKLNDGANVGIWATADRLVASGLVWPESRDLLVQKAFLMHQPFGEGHVLAFAEDPNYRAFAEATMLLFMNAVLLGPAH